MIFLIVALCVKKQLLDLGMTQKELEQIVSERTGLFVDAGYMYKILSGQREAPKISEAIRDVLQIDTDNPNKAVQEIIESKPV